MKVRYVKTVLILFILSVAVLVLSGSAAATIYVPSFPVTVTVNTVQTNGVYTGQPVLLNSWSQEYGYNYTLAPDGTYTLIGTITNTGTQSYYVNLRGQVGQLATTTINVPANSTVAFQFTVSAASASMAHVVATIGESPIMVSYSGAQYTSAPDTTSHTYNEGAMSDQVMLFNGTPTQQFMGTARPTLNSSYLFLAQVYSSIWI
jgi:hypothetical protein